MVQLTPTDVGTLNTIVNDITLTSFTGTTIAANDGTFNWLALGI
jgi:hypothetical protein